MLFDRRSSAGIADGTVTATFRRWKRTQAVTGHRYRTRGGMIEVDSVDLIEVTEIDRSDAIRAGYPDAGAAIDDLRGEEGTPVYRVRFHRVDEPDPRTVLAEDTGFTSEDVAALAGRLDRIDGRSSHGPWTRSTLEMIAQRPGIRAADLAASFDRDVPSFKRDVRTLKGLGLTLSLEVGYRLSPRGEAFLRRLLDADA
ncbi:MAG TPA: hypothetical protein VI341_00585 [Actinomycetota bacterium]